MRLRRALRSADRSRLGTAVVLAAGATVAAGGTWWWDGVPAGATAVAALAVLALGLGTALLGWWPPSWSAVAAVATAVAAHLLLAAWDGGVAWSEERVPGAVAVLVTVAIALVTWRWLNAGWALALAGVALAAAGLSVRDERWVHDWVHRPAAAALALVVLVGTARVFSKTTLRLVTVAVVVAGVVALAAAGRSEAAADAVGETGDILREARPALDELTTVVDGLDDPAPALERRVRLLRARLRQVAREVGCGRAGEARCLDWPTRRSDAADLVADVHEAVADAVRAQAAPASDLASAEAERDAARARADELGVPVQQDVRQLVASGGDALMREAFAPVLGDGLAARTGDAGWVVLAVLALLGYRQLEIVNNRRYGAPVVAAGDRALTGEFAERIASMRLVEPSPVPGGAAATQLVDVLREGVGIAQGQRGLSKALAAAWALVYPAAGVTAHLELYGPPLRPPAPEPESPPPGESPPPADGPVRICVTVRTTAGTRFVRSHTTQLAPRADAVEEAANVVAVGAVNYTRLCPPWQRWDDNDAVALGRYRRVVDDTGRHPSLEPAAAIPLLEEACRRSPATGVVRVALGHQYDAAGQPVHALREHLLARLEYERMTVARYRTATSLSMAASGPDSPWWSEDDQVAAVRHDIVRTLAESGLLARVARTRPWRARLSRPVHGRADGIGAAAAPWYLDPANVGTSRDVGRTILLLLAGHELRALKRRSAHPVLLWQARRQDERQVWLALLRDTGGRRRAQSRTVAAELIVRLRLALLAHPLTPDVPDAPGALDGRVARVVAAADLLDHADKPGAYYNLACFYATLVGAIDTHPELGRRHAAVARALAAGAAAASRRRRRPSAYGPADTPRELAAQRAVWLLDRAIRLLDAPVPSATWVGRDPDLAPIRHDPAYRERFEVPSVRDEEGTPA